MANPSVPVTDGHALFVYEGETFDTYFKVFGQLDGRTRDPLVVLHGGPGLTHDYMLPLSNLATVGIPVILYDQLGNGLSTHLREKPPTFWTVDLFIDELISLLNHLSIQDSFDILGHSWGGILAGEFEVRRQPVGLRHIIFSNALASGKLYGQSERQLLQAFPKWVQEGMELDMEDPKKFYAALKVFYAKHCCQIQPFPQEVTASFEAVFNEEYGDGTVLSAP
ncbi:hypothetical protein EVJ58_g884 [Rhodofomes roseus]|uniref:AB hydrolase-1 domain-containing protein n=1 Tax=Rhodofomes roseus TaxID=34475 RepID=A0A4Y9Z5N4_9APHY|nr:hypothetical protein EVJ58_g884 [Rhodofomes roseus]